MKRANYIQGFYSLPHLHVTVLCSTVARVRGCSKQKHATRGYISVAAQKACVQPDWSCNKFSKQEEESKQKKDSEREREREGEKKKEK